MDDEIIVRDGYDYDKNEDEGIGSFFGGLSKTLIVFSKPFLASLCN